MKLPTRKTRVEPLDLTTPAHIENGVRLTTGRRRMLAELVALRHGRGISQEQLADAIGIHKSGISRFEAQRELGNPTLDVIVRYAHAVGAMISVRVEPVERWERSTLMRSGAPVGRWLETRDDETDDSAPRSDTDWVLPHLQFDAAGYR